MDFAEARKLDPNDKFIERESLVAQKLVKQKREKERQAYSKMFA